MKEEKEQTVIEKTLLYLENYREMERYIKDAVSETSQVPDIGKYNISAEKAFLQSIRECKAETIILFEHAIERNIRRCSRMTGRIKIIRKTTSVVDGRRQQEEKEFFSCWCDVKSLGTNEKYNALQIGLENTIMFETRACDKMEEIRLNLKEFYAVYKGVEFKIYDACPMFTDDRKYQLKCRAGA